MQDNLFWFFDALSQGLEALIDAILWVLQTPHPLIMVALFTSLKEPLVIILTVPLAIIGVTVGLLVTDPLPVIVIARVGLGHSA